MGAILPHPCGRRHLPAPVAADHPESPPLRTTPMRNRLTYAVFGVLATVVGVALGHLVAGLTNPAASPVLAVGSQVIDLTPTPLKEFAIRQFGNSDKAILIGSVFAGVLALAAVAGVLARRRFAVGAGMLVALVAIAAYTAAVPPGRRLHRPLPEPRRRRGRCRLPVAAAPPRHRRDHAARPGHDRHQDRHQTTPTARPPPAAAAFSWPAVASPSPPR